MIYNNISQYFKLIIIKVKHVKLTYGILNKLKELI